MRRLPALCRAVAVLALISALAGCAAKQPGPPTADEAKAVYGTFLARDRQNTAPAFSLSGSMSFSRANRSGRLNYRLFGNAGGATRLDLTTPVGGAYASLFEDNRGFYAFVPDKNAVYRHSDSRQGAAKLGMPLPFSLSEMAAVTSGRFEALAPARYASAKKTAEGYEYAFSGGTRLSSLTLDFAGNPRHLVGVGIEPWRIDFADDEAGPGLTAPVARRITLTTPGGATLVVRVKTVQPRPSPYPAADLELPVPPNAAEHALDGAGDEPSLPEL
ncbi:hypothetical protein [Solidesulfovibrio sp.]|uniref:hypothetical protein n=1 Tax=Solidesulfovibrio sp. TaxID=2910990 RepID=UPI00262ED04E|nr:hypothetical protein [Solidesulfovibrio sp.]